MTRPTARVHDYKLFGLKLSSAIELPELVPGEPCDKSDVNIEYGIIAASQMKPGLHSLEDGLLLVIRDVARYLIRGGSQIIAEPMRDVPARNVRLYLLGSAFGALLHQRGLFPLHANAVEIDGQSVAFMGEAGAGKSTLAAWFHDHGYAVIADDVCVVSFDESGRRPVIFPGLPRLRLWQDSLELSGRNSAEFEYSYANDPSWKKFDVPLVSGRSDGGAFSLAGIYHLEKAPDFSVARVEGVAAAELVFAHTYRGFVIGALKAEKRHLKAALELVKSVPIFRLQRPWDMELRDRVGQMIIDQVRHELAQSSAI